MELWSLFQEQILGMKWLNEWLGRGLSALGLDIHGRLGGSVQFFLYDSLKITVLLCVLIFSISYIQSYFPPERSKHILGRLHGVGANLVSALLGTVTPFCSCSSIPLFIGFTNAGLPLGVTFSFLISSPMVDLGSLVLLMSIFGTKVAIFYVVVGLALAVAGGTLLERLHMEKHVEQFVFSAGSIDIESPELTRRERVRYAREQAVSTFKKVAPYILVGVGLGAVIHNWIPAFVSIPLPLSVGFSSGCEVLECQVLDTPLDQVPAKMNAALPAGITIQRCYEAVRPVKELCYVNYIVTLEYEAGAPFGAESAIRDLLARDCLVMTKRSKKAKSGFTEVDLIPLIARATVEERRDTIALDLVLRAQNPGLNPELVVAAIREHCPDAAPDFVIFHRRAVLDGQFQTWE